jgi:hypothetical protein
VTSITDTGSGGGREALLAPGSWLQREGRTCTPSGSPGDAAVFLALHHSKLLWCHFSLICHPLQKDQGSSSVYSKSPEGPPVLAAKSTATACCFEMVS